MSATTTSTGSNAKKTTSTDQPPVEHRDPAYFQYYAQLQHQQNMLADHVRTSTYRHAIVMHGRPAIEGRVVMDVGAGSGVLSAFACQAGARTVYAVEASGMAAKLRHFIDESVRTGRNGKWLRDKAHIQVLSAKVEDLATLPEAHALGSNSVDVLISEPIGVFLVHERMLESFIHARDAYLKSNGLMYPATGTIHLQPFTDSALWLETANRARWWNQTDFHGIDFSPMAEIARQEFFSMAVVGPFSPHSLMATSSNATTTTADSSFHMDFRTITQQEMLSFTVPIRWSIAVTGLIHGVASWFDCHFPNAEAMAATQSTSADPQSILLTTHPAAPITHWQQVRFVLDEPLAANAGDMVVGGMRCTANAMRSYDLAVDIWIEDGSGEARPNSKRHGTWNLHDQIYNYNYAHGGAVAPAGSSNDASMGVAATNAMAVDGAEREWLGLYAPVGRSSHRDQHVDQ